MESYNGENRLKHTIIRANPVINYAESIRDILK
jgi:hypothetical protein